MVKKVFLLVVFALLLIVIVQAKPLVVYGKEVNMTRVKSLINQIPAKCFDGIDVLYFYNKPSYSKNILAYFQYNVGGRHNKEIIIYQFKEQTDSEVINLLNHELGHYIEYKFGFRVSSTTKFNETFAKKYICKN